jgi:hypothetical protein
MSDGGVESVPEGSDHGVPGWGGWGNGGRALSLTEAWAEREAGGLPGRVKQRRGWRLWKGIKLPGPSGGFYSSDLAGW